MQRLLEPGIEPERVAPLLGAGRLVSESGASDIVSTMASANRPASAVKVGTLGRGQRAVESSSRDGASIVLAPFPLEEGLLVCCPGAALPVCGGRPVASFSGRR